VSLVRPRDSFGVNPDVDLQPLSDKPLMRQHRTAAPGVQSMLQYRSIQFYVQRRSIVMP
jgi:hypothetical protein